MTNVWEIQADKTIIEKTISPADFGLPESSLLLVKGGDAAYNSGTMRDLLDGTLTGPVLDFVLLNSAALLYVAGKSDSLLEAVQMARMAISSGAAKRALADFSQITLEQDN